MKTTLTLIAGCSGRHGNKPEDCNACYIKSVTSLTMPPTATKNDDKKL